MSGPASRRQAAPRGEERGGRITSPIRTMEDARASMRELGISTSGMSRVDCSAEFNAVLGMLGEARPGWGLPPVVVQVPDEALDLYVSRGHGNRARRVHGLYVYETNLIIMRESDMPGPPGEISELVGHGWNEGTNEVVCHEMLHYLAFVGRGWGIDFREGRRNAHADMPKWLEEGIVQSIAGEAGRAYERIPYPEGTLVAVILEMCAGGPAATREAFISGDFRALQEAVDRILGPRTFEMLMGRVPTPEGDRVTNGAQGFAFLMERIYGRQDTFDMGAFGRDGRVVRSVSSILRFIQPYVRREEYSIGVRSGER